MDRDTLNLLALACISLALVIIGVILIALIRTQGLGIPELAGNIIGGIFLFLGVIGVIITAEYSKKVNVRTMLLERKKRESET